MVRSERKEEEKKDRKGVSQVCVWGGGGGGRVVEGELRFWKRWLNTGRYLAGKEKGQQHLVQEKEVRGRCVGKG